MITEFLRLSYGGIYWRSWIANSFSWSTEFLSKEERASTFCVFPSLQKLPGIFLILTVEMTELFQLKSDRSFHGVRGSQ